MTDHIFKLSLKNSVEWYITLLYYIQVEWSGVEWTGLDWSEVDLSGVEWIPVHINICTWLYFVKSPVESSGVHMDSWGDSKVLVHINICTWLYFVKSPLESSGVQWSPYGLWGGQQSTALLPSWSYISIKGGFSIVSSISVFIITLY